MLLRVLPMLLSAGMAVSAAAQDAVQFQDVTAAAGIDAPLGGEVIRGGIGVGDFDGNGFPDLFLSGYQQPSRLYLNQGDGTFAEDPGIAPQVALPDSTCVGSAVADFDNDGWPDIYVACHGDNHLLRNLQGQGFEDVIGPDTNQPERSEGAAWGDLTGNGHPDLVVITHRPFFPVDPGNPDHHDRILLNDGSGNFTNIAQHLDIVPRLSHTLAATIADVDMDGRPDIYIINDRYDGNVLLLNQGPGCNGWCFANVSEDTGASRPANGMGIAVTDHDRDGDWDLVITHTSEQVLLENQQDGDGGIEFIDRHAEAGFDIDRVAWGVIAADFANDGDEDVYFAVNPLSSQPADDDFRDRVFRNAGSGAFSDASFGSGLHSVRRSEAAAWLDFDRDGRVDLAVAHPGDGYRLYRNVTSEAGHWIGFRLHGGHGFTRDALGTRVRILADEGLGQMRERRSGGSRGASHDGVLHFGLGERTSAEVEVTWPGGPTQRLGRLTAGCYWHIEARHADRIFADRFGAPVMATCE